MISDEQVIKAVAVLRAEHGVVTRASLAGQLGCSTMTAHRRVRRLVEAGRLVEDRPGGSTGVARYGSIRLAAENAGPGVIQVPVLITIDRDSGEVMQVRKA